MEKNTATVQLPLVEELRKAMIRNLIAARFLMNAR